MKKKVAIIGAGPAGLTAGYVLSKFKDYEIDIYESSAAVGGMCKTIELWGCKVDIGPHRFFSTDKRINTLWLEVAHKEYKMVNRLTRIYYNNKFYYYPLKAFNALLNLGIITSFLCILSYIYQQIFPVKQKGDFESWVIKRFGKKLYSIFFKTYSEKLWGIPCTDLDVDFAAQRIKKFSLFEAIKSALGKKQNHKTLVDVFAYPTGGTGMIYEKMAAKIKQHHHIHLNQKVKKVLVKDDFSVYGLELENGEKKLYDYVISSMPITNLITTMDFLPTEIRENAYKLKFRNTIIVYLKIEAIDVFPDNWLYIHSTSLRVGRITNFRNWVPDIYGEAQFTIVALEYWCNAEDDFWKLSDAELIALGKKEFLSTKLLKNKNIDINDGYVYRINKCYPVYNTGYKNYLKPIEVYLSRIKNLHLIGRYGSFKYNNQDHSILMGLMVAENISQNKNHNLWDTNTDYENYQEQSTITEVGL